MKTIKMVIEFDSTDRTASHGDIWEDTEVIMDSIKRKIKAMKGYEFQRGACEIK